MNKSRDEILAEVLRVLRELAEDWGYSGDIVEQTLLFGDLGLESLDVVVLATSLQEQFGQVFPFSEFFTEIGQREFRDVTVSEWVDFIHSNRKEVPA